MNWRLNILISDRSIKNDFFPGFGFHRRSSTSQNGSTPTELSRKHQAEEGLVDAEPRPDVERGPGGQVRCREHQAVAGGRGGRQIRTLQLSSQGKCYYFSESPVMTQSD